MLQQDIILINVQPIWLKPKLEPNHIYSTIILYVYEGNFFLYVIIVLLISYLKDHEHLIFELKHLKHLILYTVLPKFFYFDQLPFFYLYFHLFILNHLLLLYYPFEEHTPLVFIQSFKPFIKGNYELVLFFFFYFWDQKYFSMFILKVILLYSLLQDHLINSQVYSQP